MANCYYGEAECDSDDWKCQTCGETYCGYHFHNTDKGQNVECVACERERKESQEEPTFHDCYHCGKPMMVNEAGIANHLTVFDGIDHNADANHVPIPDGDMNL